MSDTKIDAMDNAIAIIGMDGRFPGAESLEQFWQNLRDGVESISFFSDEELKATGINPVDFADPHYVRAKGVLDAPEFFDAEFFGYSPAEAECMDPQQRVFLETGWSALENAGYDPEQYDGLIGVYAGTSTNSYFLNNLYALRTSGKLFAIDKDFIATRLSYKLNLKGPSLAIQTACSTSLVAICEACQSLLDYRCDMALSGGVSISVPVKTGYRHQEGSIASRDGHCRAFDIDASGTVSGAGVGVVVLKRLADALADGDTINAIIRGFSVNNDGALKVGYSAPSVSGQADAIAMALALADVSADTVSYVECHGTGTTLGDPIEIAALTKAFRESTDNVDYCAIGSVKTNIGHLDAAAGVTGLIKTVLSLQQMKIPPSLHFTKPNPKIDFANSPFFVNTHLRDWQTKDAPRRAGVSSFGIGGTNAHVVLEEAPVVDELDSAEPEEQKARYQLLLISARNESALDEATTRLAVHLRAHPEQALADVAYTLQIGRSMFTHRRMLVCQDHNEAIAMLEQQDGQGLRSAVGDARQLQCVFMFSGQGSQYPNMMHGLYLRYCVFRETVDECCRVLQPLLDLDLLELLYPQQSDEANAVEQLTKTCYAQPALFVVEYALAKLWMSWGVQPVAMIGHSIGEYVAACLASIFTLKDALKLVAERGRLMQAQPQGGMLSVPLAAEDLAPLLTEDLCIAVINAPTMCVVSGPETQLHDFAERMTENGHAVSRLHTSHAFHSTMMQAAADELKNVMAQIPMSAPVIPLISNLSGDWLKAHEATDANYWASQLRNTVQFSAGVARLLQEQGHWYLEAGPGNTLVNLLRQQPACGADTVALASVRHPRQQRDDQAFILDTIGQSWLAGIGPSWADIHAGKPRRRIPLPVYPFQRNRYWIEPHSGSHSESLPAWQVQRSEMKDWISVPSWTRSAHLNQSDQQIQDAGPMLLFLDDSGIGDSVAQFLLARNNTFVCVRAGDHFQCLESGQTYAIDPANKDDYQSLLTDLATQNVLPTTVLHLWNLDKAAGNSDLTTNTNRLRTASFYSLLYLAQAIGTVSPDARIRIIIASSEVHETSGLEQLCPEKSLLMGACRVIGDEYQGLSCCNVDFETSQHDKQSMIDWLVAECDSDCVDAVVAYRGGHRWLQSYARLKLDPQAETPARLCQQGTYLITGGLGGIGLALAQYLARSVQANLILTSRSFFPAHDDWDQWLLEHADTDRSCIRIRQMQALEAAGAQVLIASVDVANESAMRQLLTDAENRFGPVRGVIHAAGVAGSGVMQLKTAQAASAVLSPKVAGTQVLADMFAERELDFCILCSSLASVFGGPGQMDYCAANAWMDAFAHVQNKNHKNTTSINWDTWREVGMAVDADLPDQLKHDRDRALSMGISTDEGVDIFKRVLALNPPQAQILVSTRDIEQLLARRHASTISTAEDLVDTAVDLDRQHVRPSLLTPYVAPRTESQKRIAVIWGELFNISEIGIHDNFFELGGHSLLAIQAVARLRKRMKVEMSIEKFLEQSTVESLAIYVDALNSVKPDTSTREPSVSASDRDEFDL